MKGENAHQRKRKLVYATSRNSDRNLDVLKRRRPPVLDQSDIQDEPLSDEERGDTPLSQIGGPCTLIRLPSLTSVGLAGDNDPGSNSDDSTSNKLPETVKLRQSVDPGEIKRVKEENVRDSQEFIKNVKDDDAIEDVLVELEQRSSSRQDSDDKTHKLVVRKDYTKKYKLPPILYLSDLIERIQPFLSIVEAMYKHKVQSPYKFEATAVSEASNSAVLSLSEFRSMDINKIVAGYYGLRRQLCVGEEILKHYKQFLLKRQGKTMNWWGVADFANYVLAPEVLASLCISEMNLGDDIYDPATRENAYDIFRNTVEFGLVVADTDPLESWEVHVEK